MNKAATESKRLVLIIVIAYAFNLFLGWLGFFLSTSSGIQLVLYQVGNAFAISASVMAARYVGIKGQHVAASAYILLGITHGISLAALSRAGINIEREATMAMPMIPALIFMFWCNLYPLWIRLLSLLPCICFAMVYVNTHLGESTIGWTLYTGYATLQIIEMLWGIYLFLDWRKSI